MDRILLGNDEFEGRNAAYVLAADDDLALVDTGIATPPTRRQLFDGLEERGYGPEDVDDIVLTHWHPDHAGLAGEIQAASGASVYIHEADAPIVAEDMGALEAMQAAQIDLFEQWGMPEDDRETLLSFLHADAGIGGESITPTPIEDGDELAVGGHTLETIHAPGHTAGLCCFAIDDGREAFSGDAVLPVYTPNVGGADVRVDRPLAQYIDTLERIADRDFDVLWPGHRDPIDDPTERARAIIEHHQERTARVIEVLREHGPADAWTVSAHLFGDLEGIHVMHGPGEAYAHLDHLTAEGVLSEVDGVYRLLDADVPVGSIVG